MSAGPVTLSPRSDQSWTVCLPPSHRVLGYVDHLSKGFRVTPIKGLSLQGINPGPYPSRGAAVLAITLHLDEGRSALSRGTLQ